MPDAIIVMNKSSVSMVKSLSVYNVPVLLFVLLAGVLFFRLFFPVSGDGRGQQTKIIAIEEQSRAIDAIVNQLPASGDGLVRKEIRYWELEGLFGPAKTPKYIHATFAQGSVVREETYYFNETALIRVIVNKFWDADDEKDAPSPQINHDFIVSGNRIIRHKYTIERTMAVTETDGTIRPADGLAGRANTFAAALSEPDIEDNALESLETLWLPN